MLPHGPLATNGDRFLLWRYDWRGMRRAEIRAGLALLLGTACHVWRERPVTAPAPTPVAHGLRVTTNGGARRLTLERAIMRPDSVVGFLVEAADRRGPTSTRAVVEEDWVVDKSTAPRQRVAVAASDVRSLEERSTSSTRTAALLVVVAAVVAGAAYAAVAALTRPRVTSPPVDPAGSVRASRPAGVVDSRSRGDVPATKARSQYLCVSVSIAVQLDRSHRPHLRTRFPNEFLWR